PPPQPTNRTAYAALTTLPAFNQRLHTRTCIRRPPTTAWTRCRLVRVRFLVLLFAWLTWLPVSGPLPHTSHLKAICPRSPEKSRKGTAEPTREFRLVKSRRPACGRSAPGPERRRRAPPGSTLPGRTRDRPRGRRTGPDRARRTPDAARWARSGRPRAA